MRTCQFVKFFLHCNHRHHRHEADLHKSEFYQLENWPIKIFNMRISRKLNPYSLSNYRDAPVKRHVMISTPFRPPATVSTFICVSPSHYKSQSQPQSLSRTRPPASEHLGEGHRETIDVSCGGCCDANCDDCNSNGNDNCDCDWGWGSCCLRRNEPCSWTISKVYTHMYVHKDR